MDRPRTVVCVCGCGETGDHEGRGLITRCYSRVLAAGDLADWPRLTRPIAEVLDDYQLLSSDGYDTRQIADRIGMQATALRQALTRARRRGLLTPGGGAW